MRAIFSAFIAGEILFLFLSELPPDFLIFGLAVAALITLALIKAISSLENLKFFNVSGQLILGSVFCLLLGFIWSFYLSQDRIAHLLSEEYEGVPFIVDGIIDGLPQDTAEGRRFTLKVLRWQRASSSTNSVDLEGDNVWNKRGNFPERLALGWYAPREYFSQSPSKAVDLTSIPQLIPGQRWLLPVKLKRPRGLLNPHSFDYELWMFMQDLGANGNVLPNKIAHLKSPQKIAEMTIDFRSLIEKVRWHIRRKILNAFPEDAQYPGVLVALVIGDQNAINQDDWKVFNATGIGHLISISGLHVTMLAGFGGFVAHRIWRRREWPLIVPAQKIGVLFGFITALIYSLLAGFQIPAQRTMFMVGIVAIALWTGRVMRAFDIWWWALFLVMLLNPWSVYTPGFWLSFGAVALILYAMPADHRAQQLEIPDVDWVFFRKIKESLGQACRVQLVVTIGLIPITLWWFSQISLISPIANSFAIPLVSFVVTPLAMLGAFLPSFIGDYFLWISHWVLVWMIYPLKAMSTWSWAVAHGAKPSWWSMALALLGVYWAAAPGPIGHKVYLRVLGLGLCFCLFITSFSRFSDRIAHGDFKALVWDIGQGTAVLIKTRHHHLLYDAGPLSSKSNDPGTRTILPYLRAEGVKKLDLMALSHRDSDHIGGVESVASSMPVNKLIGSIPQSHRLMKVFEKNNIPAEPCQAGNNWEWDGVQFVIWHPSPAATFDDWFHQGRPNELSCVIEVRNAHFSFWMTGDIERMGESELVARLNEDLASQKALSSRVKVLMAPHHGSKTSSSAVFLNAIKPDWAFSQTGHKNRYNHPHPKIFSRYQEFGINLLDTSLTGAQIWKFEQEKMDLELFRNSVRRIWHR